MARRRHEAGSTVLVSRCSSRWRASTGGEYDSDLDEEERKAIDEREKRATLLRNAKLGR